MELNRSPVRREQTTDPDEVIFSLSRQIYVEEVEIKGTPIKVLPGVFSPRISHAADFMIDNWRIGKGCSTLDLGCGCGVLGIFSLLEGAESVVALDINPKAVENAQLNFFSLGLENRALAKESDTYNTLTKDDYFDVILLSPPYADRPARNLLEQAFFDEGYTFLSNALKGARGHLKQNGRVFLNFSDQGSITRLIQIVQKNRLYIEQFVVQRPSIIGGHSRIFLELKIPDEF